MGTAFLIKGYSGRCSRLFRKCNFVVIVESSLKVHLGFGHPAERGALDEIPGDLPADSGDLFRGWIR